MFVRWNFTVCSAIQSSLPICPFDRPRASADRIASSRSVSPAFLGGARRRGVGEPDRGEDRAGDSLA